MQSLLTDTINHKALVFGSSSGICFASDATAFISGQALVIDGGQSVGG